jgi:TM2 domain-containing membrane protein YozV
MKKNTRLLIINTLMLVVILVMTIHVFYLSQPMGGILLLSALVMGIVNLVHGYRHGYYDRK